MRYFTIISAFFVLIGLNGCGYKEGVVTGAQKSYLYFTGNVTNVSVSVDNSPMFAVKEGANERYQVQPGKHSITLYRGNEMISKREIFLSDGIAKEIEVQP